MATILSRPPTVTILLQRLEFASVPTACGLQLQLNYCKSDMHTFYYLVVQKEYNMPELIVFLELLAASEA